MKNLLGATQKIIDGGSSLWNSDKLKGIIIVDNVMTFVSSWPLLVHLFSGFFCLGSSSAFHLMWITNERINNLLSRLDYGGICVLIMGSSYPMIFYSFSCSPIYGARNFFLALITLSSTATFIMTMSPEMNKKEYVKCRSFTFIFLGLSASFPFLYLNYMDKES